MYCAVVKFYCAARVLNVDTIAQSERSLKFNMDGHSIDTYNRWESTIPLIVAAVSGLISVILLVFSVFLNIEKCKNKFFEEVIYRTSKLILQDSLERDKENKYKLFGREVGIGAMWMTVLSAPIFLYAAFITFWGIFIIDQSFACDPDRDCFAYNLTSGDILGKDPVDNCSDFDSMDNVTVICYHFVFQYAEGFGAAGGVIALAPAISKAYIGTVLFFLRLRCNCLSRGCGNCSWRKIILFLIMLLPVIIICIILTLVINIPTVFNALVKTYQSALKLSAYMLTIMWTFCTSVQLILYIVKYSTEYVEPSQNVNVNMTVTIGTAKNETNPLINDQRRTVTYDGSTD